ncbi:MAG TPA: ABC transporter substrate-binding protein, partial [Sutterella sp.]|nr:ABC transporter substrate-binding protein [Sutterella sp.]
CGEDKKVNAVKNIGVIQLVEHAALDLANKGIVDAVNARGLKVKFDQQNAQADQSNLHNIAQRFVTQKSDLIFAIATPAAQSVANATKSIPIVATAVTDFEIAKLVKSNAKPDTNVTGSSDMNPVEAQVDLILALCPKAKRIGTIYNSSEINSQFQIDIAKKHIQKRGLKYVEVTVSSVNDIQQAAVSLVGKVDAIYVPTDNVVASAIPLLTAITTPKRIPVVVAETGMLQGGGLATLGVDYYELGKIAGNMGADILEGKAKPQDMPIRVQTEFKAVINTTAAKALGLNIPKALADKSELKAF